MKRRIKNRFLLPALMAGLGLMLAGRVAAQSPPTVTLQPTNSSVTVPLGGNVSFAVSVTGSGPFSYQWQHAGTNLSNGIITTVAGNGTNGYSGDWGAATNAELNGPSGVAVDATGNLFIGDGDNNRIRKVVSQSPTLVLNDVGFGNAGAYDVVVSNPYGSVTSSVVNLTIGIILSAPQMTVGNTNFAFLLSGPAGSNYVLQVSPDLSSWSSVSTSTMPAGATTMTLSNVISGYNRRFYRALMQ